MRTLSIIVGRVEADEFTAVDLDGGVVSVFVLNVDQELGIPTFAFKCTSVDYEFRTV